MHDIERQVRLHLPDFPDDEAEVGYSWAWILLWALAIAGILTIGAICVLVAL